ncbi:hypothetical protein ACPVPU_11620 [Sphingomonas sp. CJ99]
MRESEHAHRLGTVSRKQGLTVGVGAAALFIASLFIWQEPVATTLSLSFVIVCCVSIICWPLRHEKAFSPYMISISILHVAASFMISPYVEGKLTYLLTPFVFLDIFANVYALKWMIGSQLKGRAKE